MAFYARLSIRAHIYAESESTNLHKKKEGKGMFVRKCKKKNKRVAILQIAAISLRGCWGIMDNKQELSYGVYVGFFLYVVCLGGSLRVNDFCFRSTGPLFVGNSLI